MSGGSLNYLYRRLDDWPTLEEIAEVVEILRELPEPASSFAERMAAKVDAARAARDAFAEMADVIRSLEWWLSADYSQDQVLDSINQYLADHPEERTRE